MDLNVTSDVERIVRVCGEHDLTVSMDEARRAWRAYSDGLCARWMILPKSDDRLFNEVREYLPGGEFEHGGRTCSKCHGAPALPEFAFCLTCTRETLNWLRQTVHRASHNGPLDECQKNTCDAALKAMGLR